MRSVFLGGGGLVSVYVFITRHTYVEREREGGRERKTGGSWLLYLHGTDPERTLYRSQSPSRVFPYASRGRGLRNWVAAD